MKQRVRERDIGGVIFQVEDNAHEQLDIYRRALELRESEIPYWEQEVAEVLLQTLNEEYPVVTIFDVEIAVNEVDLDSLQVPKREVDFQQKEARRKHIRRSVSPQKPASNRLVRNKSREMIGGVASGLANLLGIDELWVRLVWVASALGISIFSYFSGSWFVLAYLVMWAVLPSSRDLPDNDEVRRMLRHPEDKKIGGVAAGIARYLNIDPALVRFGIVLSLFLNGGASVGLYLLLWALMPEADAESEMHAIRSRPFTFEDAEQKVKQWLNISSYRDEEPAWFRTLWGVPRWGARLLGRGKSNKYE